MAFIAERVEKSAITRLRTFVDAPFDLRGSEGECPAKDDKPEASSSTTAVPSPAKDATKPEVKAAVELLWKDQKIEVESVQVTNVKGKKKRFGRYMGRRSDWKKAYVSIKTGQEINFSDIAQGENK